MSESAEDKLSRVQSMVDDDGWTWDLSPNDKAALKHVLRVIAVLATSLGDLQGLPAQMLINKVSEEVQSEQAKD